jgi:hypothetical protein
LDVKKKLKFDEEEMRDEEDREFLSTVQRQLEEALRGGGPLTRADGGADPDPPPIKPLVRGPVVSEVVRRKALESVKDAAVQQAKKTLQDLESVQDKKITKEVKTAVIAAVEAGPATRELALHKAVEKVDDAAVKEKLNAALQTALSRVTELEREVLALGRREDLQKGGDNPVRQLYEKDVIPLRREEPANANRSTLTKKLRDFGKLWLHSMPYRPVEPQKPEELSYDRPGSQALPQLLPNGLTPELQARVDELMSKVRPVGGPLHPVQLRDPGTCPDTELTKTLEVPMRREEDMSLTGTHGEILEATIQLLRREESMSPASMYGDIIERTIEVLRQEQDMELTQAVGKILNFQNVTGRTKDRTAKLETRTKLEDVLANRRRAGVGGSPGDSDNSWT